jgi:hypothetical protein
VHPALIGHDVHALIATGLRDAGLPFHLPQDSGTIVLELFRAHVLVKLGLCDLFINKHCQVEQANIDEAHEDYACGARPEKPRKDGE